MKKKIFVVMSLVAIMGTAPITSLAADDLLKTGQVLNKQELEGINQDKILKLLKEVLNTEVLEGTITQQEADTKYVEIENGNLPPFGAKPNEDEFLNTNNMTEEERIQKFNEMLNKEVEEGKLTQAEADQKYVAIKNGQKPVKPESDDRPENPESQKKLDKTVNIEIQKSILNDTEKLALYKKILSYQIQNEYLTQAEADKKYEEMKEDISKKMNSSENEK